MIQRLKQRRASYSLYLLVILTMIAWLSLIPSLDPLFQQEHWDSFKSFITHLLGFEKENVAFLSKNEWLKTLSYTKETLQMSLLAISIASMIGISMALVTARNYAFGQLTLHTSPLKQGLYYLGRLFLLVCRSVPEVMWAMIFLYFLKPGIFPGALALGIHNAGVLGKLMSELIEEMNPRPIQQLVTHGARTFSLQVYGIIPTLMPKAITYILYRLDNIIRASLIVGLVGAGGLGMQFRLAMSFFKYTHITLYLLCYFILIYFTDWISDQLKRLIQSE